MNNFLTSLAVVLVVILTALFAVPLFIDWDDYRHDFEVRLSEILDNRVELDGSLTVRLLPSPYVRAENIRLGDSGVKGKPVVDVKELTLWVSLPPLLKGVIEASKVTLDQPSLLLKFDERGRPVFKSSRERAGRTGGRNNTPTKNAALSGFQLSPKLISLKNVQIVDGEVILQTGTLRKDKRTRSLAIHQINGALSAATLNGPFYFNGWYELFSTEQTVRIAVGLKENEVFPVEGRIALADGPKFEFKGKLDGLKSAWRLDGDLTAKLDWFGKGVRKVAALQNSDTKQYASQKVSGEVSQKTIVPGVIGQETTLTSKFSFTSKRVDFKDILLRGGNLAQPQTVRGDAFVGWDRDLLLSAALMGTVIDVNSLYAKKNGNTSDSKASPGASLLGFSTSLMPALSLFETIDVTSQISQVLIGSGDVRDFRLAIAGKDGVVNVKEFYGRVPGSGRLNLSGKISDGSGDAQFAGQLYLRGLQFDKFLEWGAPHLKSKGDGIKGKFLLSGQLLLNKTGFIINDARGDLAGTKLRGGVTHQISSDEIETEFTRLRLHAGLVDLSELLGRPVAVKDYRAALDEVLRLKGGFIGQTKDDASQQNAKKATVNAEIEFSIETLKFSDAVQRDVALLWRNNDQKSQLVSLSLKSETGLKMSYEVGDQAGHKNHFVLAADNGNAVSELLTLSGLKDEKDSSIDPRVFDKLLPLRLAVHSQKQEGAVLYRVDGTVAQSDAAFSFLVPGDNEQAPITIFGGMESDNGAKMASLLLPFDLFHFEQQQVSETNTGSEGRGLSRITIAATGTVPSGFKGQLKFESGDISLAYDGLFGLDTPRLATDGVLELKGKRSRDVLALFGMPGLGLDKDSNDDEMSAKVKFAQTGKGFAVSDLKISVGDRLLQGTGLIEDNAQGSSYRVAVATQRMDLRSFFEPLMVKKLDGSAQKTDEIVWSKQPFLANQNKENKDTKTRGAVTIVLNELQLTDQLSISNARLTFQLDGDQITISKFQGDSLGGKLIGSGVLRPQLSGGYRFNGVLDLQNARLEQVGSRSEMNLGRGEFSLNLSLSGSGNNLHELVTSLIGEGGLRIENGELTQLNPKTVRSAAIGYLEGTILEIGTVKDLLEREIERAPQLPIGSLDLAVQLLDGSVSLRQTDLGVRPGRLGIVASLKLEDLSWAGNWTIEGAQKSGALTGLPPIYRRLKGGFKGDQTVSVELDAGEYLRFLELKYKEKELKTLEKQRRKEQAERLREERRLAEEKLKQIEAEKKRLLQEQQELNAELERTELPPLQAN